MVDKPQSSDDQPAGPEANSATPPLSPIRKGPGHRGADMRDAMAEMTERAHVISQEAGSKIAAAMKDVISAAAGIAGFAIESARDLVQFMVRRGQMTQEEADKLLREAEEAHGRRPAAEKSRATATKIATDRATAAKAEAIAREAVARAEAMAAGPTAFSAPRPAVVHRPHPTPAASHLNLDSVLRRDGARSWKFEQMAQSSVSSLASSEFHTPDDEAGIQFAGSRAHPKAEIEKWWRAL